MLHAAISGHLRGLAILGIGRYRVVLHGIEYNNNGFYFFLAPTLLASPTRYSAHLLPSGFGSAPSSRPRTLRLLHHPAPALSALLLPSLHPCVKLLPAPINSIGRRAGHDCSPEVGYVNCVVAAAAACNTKVSNQQLTMIKTHLGGLPPLSRSSRCGVTRSENTEQIRRRIDRY
jgi:hypothetical protein